MAKKIIVDNRFAHIAEAHWGKAYEILPSKTIAGLPEPVCAHPDMALACAGDVYIAEKTAYDYYKALLSEASVLCGATALDRNYPLDIAYNVLISEQKAFANLAYMDSVLKSKLIRQGYELIPVRQGYAKCASAVAGKCIITADSSIARAAGASGFSVLKIAPGDVVLSGYDYGFIGGASGFVDGKLLFFGDITRHRDFCKIKAFLEKNGVEFAYIPDFPLTDVGTLVGI